MVHDALRGRPDPARLSPRARAPSGRRGGPAGSRGGPGARAGPRVRRGARITWVALSLGKQYDAARAELEAAITLAPSLYEGHYLFGRVCWAQGRFEEAARHFDDAAAVRPEDPEAPTMLASVCEALKDPDRAKAAHRRGLATTRAHLELYPNDARALYHGAGSLRRLGEEVEAREWADRARALAGDDSSAFYNLGCFYAIGGDIDQAFDCLNRAVDVGYAHREWIEHDVDLEPLYGDPRWGALLARFGPTQP